MGGLASIVALLMTEPELARAVIVEAAAGGEEAQRRHWAAINRLARMLDRETAIDCGCRGYRQPPR